ncbi:MAG: UBP-type zinc finger domain-containing protein [Patescibacteria group bacterium]
MIKEKCTHKDQMNTFPQKDISVCEDCIKTGDSWVSLRQCLNCGHVGCCDDSKNTHATKHFQKTKHPVMKSVTPGEEFTWCYIDKIYL